MRLLLSAITLCLTFVPVSGSPAAIWHDCVAWGTSHTGRYTFSIALEPCAVYWLQLDRHLNVIRCEPPWIVAVKPFAVSSGWELHFNIATGYFEDFTPTWSDRGRCTPRVDESKP